MNWGLVLQAGIVATLVLTLLMYLVPPLIGMPPTNIATMLGTMLGVQPGPTAFWMGMIWHFVNGVIFVLVYAGILVGFQQQSTWGTGLGFGFVLWLLGSMLLMPLLMTFHPLVQAGQLENPGFFLLNIGEGWAPALFTVWGPISFLVSLLEQSTNTRGHEQIISSRQRFNSSPSEKKSLFTQ